MKKSLLLPSVLVACVVISPAGRSQVIQQRLTPNVTNPGDATGSAVNIDGDVAIVGVPLHDARAIDHGSAFIFRWTGERWLLEDRLDPEGPTLEDHPDPPYGTPVAVSGTEAFVGARQDDDSAGIVLVFRDNRDGTWSEHQRLRAADVQTGDRFGSHIRIDGTRAVIGADQDANGGAGSAYIYRLDGGSWVYEDKLVAADGAEQDRFGFTVDIEGNFAVVAASGDDNASGAAYVFRRTGTQWTQEAKLTATDRAVGDRPLSVAISNGTVMLGASYQDSRGEDAGAVYVFDRDSNGNWSQTAKLTASDASAGDRFGASLAMRGEVAVIGAPGRTRGTGAAYVFDKLDTGWVEAGVIRGDGQEVGDAFGGSTSVSGGTVLVGANAEDEGRGAAYVFRVGPIVATESRPERGDVEVTEPSPNPSNGVTAVRYRIGRPARVTIALYDLLGRRIRLVIDGEAKSSGWHEAQIDAAMLASGTYVLEIMTEHRHASTTWAVVR